MRAGQAGAGVDCQSDPERPHDGDLPQADLRAGDDRRRHRAYAEQDEKICPDRLADERGARGEGGAGRGSGLADGAHSGNPTGVGEVRGGAFGNASGFGTL